MPILAGDDVLRHVLHHSLGQLYVEPDFGTALSAYLHCCAFCLWHRLTEDSSAVAAAEVKAHAEKRDGAGEALRAAMLDDAEVKTFQGTPLRHPAYARLIVSTLRHGGIRL